MKKLLILTLLAITTIVRPGAAQDDPGKNLFSYGNLVVTDSSGIQIVNYDNVTIYRVKDTDMEFPLWKDATINIGQAAFFDINKNMYRSRSGLRYFPVEIQGDNFFVRRVDAFVDSNGNKFVPNTIQLETSLVAGKYSFWMVAIEKDVVYWFEQ
jgi:hypothetical protein